MRVTGLSLRNLSYPRGFGVITTGGLRKARWNSKLLCFPPLLLSTLVFKFSNSNSQIMYALHQLRRAHFPCCYHGLEHEFRWLGHRAGTDCAFQTLCPFFPHQARNTWARNWLNSPELSPLPAWTPLPSKAESQGPDLHLSSGRWTGKQSWGWE